MSHPTYSVCACTYDDGDTVEAFFESLRPQLDERFELVVVDGGSTDGTWEFFQRQQDAHAFPVRLFEQTGAGLGRARRQAVDAARGDYVIEQVDADMVYADCLSAVLDYYHALESEIGAFHLLIPNLRVTAAGLHEATGGWKPFPNGFQENETTRRFLRAGKLRYLDVQAARHEEDDHGVRDAVDRFLYNYREKLRCGVSPWYAVWHTLTSKLPWWRKLADPFVIAAVYLWGLGEPRYDTFDWNDPLAFGTLRVLRELAAEGTYEEVVLDPPPAVEAACFDDSAATKEYSLTGVEQ
jgi:glycosyltransferase involved in cell wall biosynthesis